MERNLHRDKWNFRIALIGSIFAIVLTIFGLMYYIRDDYEKRRLDDPWYIEFRKKFNEDGKEIECYKIFRETGYLPKYCPR